MASAERRTSTQHRSAIGVTGRCTPNLWRGLLQTAFRACAILAASDTNMDAKTPADQWFRKTRDVWANVDTTMTAHRKVTEEPQ